MNYILAMLLVTGALTLIVAIHKRTKVVKSAIESDFSFYFYRDSFIFPVEYMIGSRYYSDILDVVVHKMDSSKWKCKLLEKYRNPLLRLKSRPSHYKLVYKQFGYNSWAEFNATSVAILVIKMSSTVRVSYGNRELSDEYELPKNFESLVEWIEQNIINFELLWSKLAKEVSENNEE